MDRESQIIYVEHVYDARQTAHIKDAMTALVPEDGDDLAVDFATDAEEDGVAYIERNTASEERLEYTDVDEDNDILQGVVREDPKAHAAGSEISFGEDDDIELLADGYELGGDGQRRTIEAVPIRSDLWMYFALGKRPFGQEYEVEVEIVDGEYEQIVSAPRGVVNTIPKAANPAQLGGTEEGDGLTPDPPDAAPIVKQGVSVNIIDMSAYLTQVQVQTGAPITDLAPGSFRVEAQMSDDEGANWTDLDGDPGWTEVLKGGTVQVHADLVGEVPASDPPIRRQYRYRYRVEDAEGLVSDYSTAGVEQPGLTLTADWLETLVLSAKKIFSPDVTGWRLEIGDPTHPILYWDGTSSNFSLRNDGKVFVAGDFDFGRDSRLTSDDYMELADQLSSGYQTPVLRQQLAAFDDGVSSITVPWGSKTLAGSLLLIDVVLFDDGQTVNTPSGWTLIGQHEQGHARIATFKIENASSRSGNQAVTFSGTVRLVAMYMYEWVGVGAQDVTATATATSSPLSSGSAASSGATDHLWIATFGSTGSAASFGDPSNGFEIIDHDGLTIPSPAGSHLRAMTAYKVVSGASTESSEVTQTAMSAAVGRIIAFNVKPNAATVDTPDDGHIRVFAKEKSGVSTVALKDDSGREHALPYGELGYAEITDTQTGLTAAADITGLSATVDVPPGRKLRVTAYCWTTTSTASGDRGIARISDGSNNGLQAMAKRYSGTNGEDGFCLVYRTTSGAGGSMTFKVRYERLSGTGSHSWGAAASSPSFILVEDIGPA